LQLRTTRNALVRGGAVEGFPLILNGQYEVDWLTLEHFLDLHRSVAVSSLKLYATHLVDFLAQLEVDGLNLDDVTDEWLIAYKNSLLNRENSSGIRNSSNYASQVLRTVVHYLYWLEQNKFVRNIVGETKHHKVRIQASERGIKHPLTKNGAGSSKSIVTPRKEWIETVKTYGPEREDLTERFELMIDWGMSAGLRAHEICALTISQLPVRETAVNALKEGRKVYVKLTVTKGSKVDNIPISPLLLIRTWDYIELYRPDITEWFSKKSKSEYEVYREPDEIFLSSKTGKAVTSRSFSNSIRSALLRAIEAGDLTVDEKVWTHGLRHNFTNNLLKGFDAAGVKRPEALARQATRHAHEDSLENYSGERFNEDFNG
jgi:integrase